MRSKRRTAARKARKESSCHLLLPV